MDETTNLALPLVQGAQSQKHVTVNEGLMRLDCLTQLVLEADGVDVPPSSPANGSCWAIGSAPSGDWTGRAGAVAIRSNGGWTFAQPRRGWRAFIASAGDTAVHDGVDWIRGGIAGSVSGAGMRARTSTVDHMVTPGAQSTTADVIPANVSVIGVTGIVLDPISGDATSFRVGVAGSADRYGTGIGLASGSWLRGLTGTPTAYYAHTPLVLEAEGGTFAGGRVRLAVHYLELTIPSA